MNRFRNFLSLVATALVGAAVLLAPTKAHAAFQIALQEAGVNGGLVTVVASGSDFQLGGISFSGIYGDFTVEVFGGSSHNAATLSDLLQSTTSVTNNAGTSKTLQLWVSQTNYTLPAGSSLAVESGLGGSVSIGTVGLTGIFQAYADKNNNLFGTTDFTNGSQNATQTGSTFLTGSANGTFTRTGDYSLTSLVTFDLSAGGRSNYSSHVNVTAVPAPAGMVLALIGLPFLGIGWLRRRKVKVQNS